MPTIEDITQEIIQNEEGGFVNDPDDPGGATNHGVTIGTMRRLGLDLNHDGKIDVEDVKELTVSEAVKIMMDEYFVKAGLNKLPDQVQTPVYDMNINSGSNSIKILQNTLRDLGYDLTIDGVLGPHTLGAAHKADAEHPTPKLCNAYSLHRRDYYFRLADNNPAFRKYVVTRDGNKAGWIIRAENFMTPTLRMTQPVFWNRVQRWFPNQRAA